MTSRVEVSPLFLPLLVDWPFWPHRMLIYVTFHLLPAFRSLVLLLLLARFSDTKDLEGAGLLLFTCSIKLRHLVLK